MSRLVDPKNASAASPEEKEGFATRLVKYIPAEILTIYAAIVGSLVIIPDFETAKQIGILILMILMAIATFFYFFLRFKTSRARTTHLFISPLAFLIWSYPISSALLGEWFNPIVLILSQAILVILALVSGWWLKPGDTLKFS